MPCFQGEVCQRHIQRAQIWKEVEMGNENTIDTIDTMRLKGVCFSPGLCGDVVEFTQPG